MSRISPNSSILWFCFPPFSKYLLGRLRKAEKRKVQEEEEEQEADAHPVKKTLSSKEVGIGISPPPTFPAPRGDTEVLQVAKEPLAILCCTELACCVNPAFASLVA